MILKPFYPVSIIGIVSIFISACSGGSGSSSGSNTSDTMANFSLSITDAPVDSAEAVYVEFTGVEMKPADDEAFTINFESPQSIDLLAQQGGNSAALITDEDIPAGEYNWIRLAVNAENDNVMDSYIEVSGSQFELRIPSGSQSGLKLNTNFTVLAGTGGNFTIDFDLRKSIILANNTYRLRPTLRLIDNSVASSISGRVDATLISTACVDSAEYAGAVYVFEGADVSPDDIDDTDAEPLSSAAVSLNSETNDYSYTAAFLPSGTFTLSYTCDSDDPEVDDQLTFTGTANVLLAEGVEQVLDF